jgi:hypothetical protein
MFTPISKSVPDSFTLSLCALKSTLESTGIDGLLETALLTIDKALAKFS